MNTDIFIRKAHFDDLPEIYEMMCILDEKNLDFDQFKLTFEKNIADNKIIYLVAHKDIEAIGFIGVHINSLLHHAGNVAEIQELFIKEDYRNLKIGKKLIDEAEYQCRLLGVREIEVTSNKKNISAHRFYMNYEYLDSHLKFTKRILPE